MPASGSQRKLAAILSADVHGYSRLMGEDEEATVGTLTAYRTVFIAEIEAHHGRVVDAKGDAVLAEFASVIDAVNAAACIQRELARRNRALPDARRMDFRIGVNLGDVLVKDGVIYGDGVNIAARLESLAEPGGICVAGNVHDLIESRVGLQFEFLGEQQVKNIAKPVRAYRVIVPPEEPEAPVPQPAMPGPAREAAKPALDLPDKPSIAVLPFENMSGNPEQEFFVDGLTEGLITTLSKASGLFVIARNSSFTYKGKAVNVRQVAAELGVGHVLEGSVQRIGNRVRINAQLIDGRTGHHIWAERYDRNADDLFLLQDDITFNILTACQVSLTEGEQARIYVGSSGHVNLAAIELYWQGVALFRRFNKADNAAARTLFERCIALDGEDANRLALLGFTHVVDARSGWSASRQDSLDKAYALALRAERLDSASSACKSVLSNVANLRGQHDEAIALGRQAVDLDPSSADAWYILGIVLNYAGQPGRAVDALGKAMRLSPYYPVGYLYTLGISQFLLHRSDEAVATFEACAKRNPLSRANHVWLATVHAIAGKLADARASAERAMQLDPDLTIERWVGTEAFKDQTVMQRIADALKAAGIPER